MSEEFGGSERPQAPETRVELDGLNLNENQIEEIVSPDKIHEKSAGEKDAVYGKILASSSQVSATTNDENLSGVDVSELKDRESQITHLLAVAQTQGILEAVDAARKIDDYYVLDQLHDRMLADDFHEALVMKGLIKE